MNKPNNQDSGISKRGFTLIELVIVIGILAILATVVVLALNPAQLLAQARDSQRLSDLSSVKSAIALYLTSPITATTTTNFGGSGTSCRCTFFTATSPFTCTGMNGCGSGSAVTSTAVDGTGWVNVPLVNTSGGSPLSALPIDPSSSANFFYGYVGNASNNSFEIVAKLESTKYLPKMQNQYDGGTRNDFYEIGTDLSL